MGIEERLERIEKMVLIISKEVLTSSECAILLGVSEDRVRHLVCEREIPFYKCGRKLYFKKDEVQSWQLQNRVPTNAELRIEENTRYVTSKYKQ